MIRGWEANRKFFFASYEAYRTRLLRRHDRDDSRQRRVCGDFSGWRDVTAIYSILTGNDTFDRAV